jgi:hypothetical protein
MGHCDNLLTKFCFIFFLIGNITKLHATDIVIHFSAFKVKNKLTDDSKCLQRILEQSKGKNKVRILFDDELYIFNQTVHDSEYGTEISLEGLTNTEFLLNAPILILRTSVREVNLHFPIASGSRKMIGETLPLNTALVKFNSTDIVESGWKYTANDLMAIDHISGTSVTFFDSLNFDYQPSSSILLAYQQGGIGFKNIKFNLSQQLSFAMAFTGMKVAFENCSLFYKLKKSMSSAINLTDCYNVRVHDFTFNGEIDYGFLINGSRNVEFKQIHSKDVIHPIVPATFTTNVRVEGFFGDNSMIDAHPSFLVHYKDVVVLNGSSFWNCRALGVVLENCFFQIQENVNSESLYIGVVGLTESYDYLYNEYDVVCKNVTWVHSDLMFNGLHVHKCRDFLVENCKTHAISTGVAIRRFEVKHSSVGRIYCADSNFHVTDTEFDATLQMRSEILPPLSASYDGVIVIDRCTFNGYESTDLFRYLQSPDTEVNFTSCTFGGFRGFAKFPLVSQDQYKKISMRDCRFNALAIGRFKSFSGIHYIE